MTSKKVTALLWLPTIAIVFACASGETPKEGDAIGAKVVCQDFVKDRLKSPATAEFSDEEANLIAGTWTVNGSVDSENAFGASIRNTYSCVVKHTGKDNYELVKMSGLDN